MGYNKQGMTLASRTKWKIVIDNSNSMSAKTGQIIPPVNQLQQDALTDGTLDTTGGNAISTTCPSMHIGQALLGKAGTPLESGIAPTVSSTAFTAAFAMPHGDGSASYNVGYSVAAWSDTAVTGTVTDTIVLNTAPANLVAGQKLYITGTGTESGQSQEMTVSTWTAGTKTVVFTAAITASYTHRINVCNDVVYVTSATDLVAGTKTAAAVSSTTGFTAGSLFLLQPLASNGATGAFDFTGTSEILMVESIVASTSITFTPKSSHTHYYALIPFTATTSSTKVAYAGYPVTITLTSGTNFATGLTNVYVWGPYGSGSTYSLWDATSAATASNANLIYNHLAAQTDPPESIDCSIITGLWVSVGGGQVLTLTFV
jgi:hypothetical protein